MLTVKIISLFILVVLSSCHQEVMDPVEETAFTTAPDLFRVAPGIIDEVSGIADSRNTDNTIWAHQDSGNPAELAMVSHTGELIKRLPVVGAVNRDWEDMTIAKDPSSGKNILYIADIGDNNQEHQAYFIYRFEEPAVSLNEIRNTEKISFRYQDGSHDAEAILVDEKRNDIYIITKRDTKAGIYKLAYPQSITEINVASLEGSLDYNGVTSAGFSPDGSEIIIKTYTHLYLYKKNGNEPLIVALKRKPYTIPYVMESQGEALCFKKDSKGLFTLSERGLVPFVDLRYYKR